MERERERKCQRDIIEKGWKGVEVVGIFFLFLFFLFNSKFNKLNEKEINVSIENI